jgi:hypothetical protein
METEELKYSAHANEQIRTEIKNLIDTSRSLEQVLRGWFSKADRGVFVGRGIYDEDPRKLAVRVVLKADEKEVAEIYFPDSEILPQGTSVVNINDFVSQVQRTTGKVPFDDEKFDAWETMLGFEYNDFLCGELGPWDALVPYTLAYVLSEGGEVDVSFPNPDIFDAPIADEEAIDPDSVLCMYATYQVPKPVTGLIFGFDTLKYFWKKGARVSRPVPAPAMSAFH